MKTVKKTAKPDRPFQRYPLASKAREVTLRRNLLSKIAKKVPSATVRMEADKNPFDGANRIQD